jgi:NADH-quinone oxidoreductase subunit F
MNIERIRAAAKAQLSSSGDPCGITVYIASSAGDAGATRIASLFQNAVDRQDLQAKIIRAGPLGFHDLEPIAMIKRQDQAPIFYANIVPDRVDDLVNDVRLDRCDAPRISDLAAFKMQKRIALRNCGWIDPENIYHYIEYGHGYSGLARALKVNPPDLLALIPSALKGRVEPAGSAWDAWRQFSESGNREKLFICNAVDPDPKSRTSRLLIEGDPHSVLEGILIGAYAAGATRCRIYIEEGTEGGRRLQKALHQMREHNLLGANILDSRFHFDIQIKEIPASLLLGHRTELFRCSEESQPLPHTLPAFPDACEFAGRPILLISPETLSSLSAILLGDCADSPASKIVTLSGSVVHPCTVEAPHGTTIRSLIECFGGGVPNGKAIKAVQIGSPIGPFLAPDALDLIVGCEPREESRSNIGSGTIDVLNADSRIVHATRELLASIQAQSCGKCVFCREGCLQMLTILEDISENRRRPQDLDLLVELGETMRTSCLCEFGRSAPDPVLSSIRLFRAEYEK